MNRIEDKFDATLSCLLAIIVIAMKTGCDAMNNCKCRFWTFETLPDFAICSICGAWKNKNGVITENKGEIGIAKVVTNSKRKEDNNVSKQDFSI